jgi:peptidoglycan hydrolase CwlO-like protein
MEEAKNDKRIIKAKLEEKIKQINMLEQEREEVTDKLKKRDTDLYKYKFKIKDL